MSEAHLRTLIGTGEVVTVEDSAGNEYEIWVMRPASLQQEEARGKANGKMARAKLEVLNKTGDRYDSMLLTFSEIDDKEELISRRLTYEEGDARDVAFNEILYGLEEDGSENEWAKDDKYLSLILAVTSRMSEIAEYNKKMTEGGGTDFLSEETDPEFVELDLEVTRFRTQVEERTAALMAKERLLHEGKSKKELRAELMELALDLETRMIWYEAYQYRMLYYACRYNDDRKKFYFDTPGDVAEIPDYVRTQLFTVYQKLESGTDDLKNSLSLHSS